MDWGDLFDLGDLLPGRRSRRHAAPAARRRWYWPRRRPQAAPPGPRTAMGERLAQLAREKDQQRRR